MYYEYIIKLVIGLNGEATKDIAELRAFVQRQIEETEKKIRDLEYELEQLKRVLETIDRLLMRESFKPATELLPEVEKKETETEQLEKIEDLYSKDGKLLAKVSIKNQTIIITPAEGLTFDMRASPFTKFFLNKVLLSLQREDIDAVKDGRLSEDEVLDYEITAKERIIKKIIIKNYRTERRLKRILNALRWTLEELMKNSKP